MPIFLIAPPKPVSSCPLKLGKGNEDIRIHDRPSDERGPENPAAVHGHFHIVRPLQAVADNNLAACGQHGKPVFIGGSHVFQRILAPPDIQRIAIREKRPAAKSLHPVGHRLGEVRPQEGKIPGFAEMQLDRHELVFKINLSDACGDHQLVQLFQQAGAYLAAHVGKIHFRNAHGRNLLAWRRACPRIVSGRPVPETPDSRNHWSDYFRYFTARPGGTQEHGKALNIAARR